MTRKRVSVIIEYGYCGLIPLALVFIINLIEIYSEGSSSSTTKIWFPIVFLLLSAGAFAFLKYLIRTNSQVEFDNKFLYYLDRHVPLKSIYSLKMTTTHFLNRFKIRVNYIDNYGKESFITFFPRILYLNLDELSRRIETENPKAELQKIFKGPFLIEKNKN